MGLLLIVSNSLIISFAGFLGFSVYYWFCERYSVCRITLNRSLERFFYAWDKVERCSVGGYKKH